MPATSPQLQPETALPSARAGRRDAPAFDFYPERWLAGVADLSDEDQVVLLRLLCHAWLRDGLPDDPALLARLAGGRQVSAEVLAKFPPSPHADDLDPRQGRRLRRNPRLEEIRHAQRLRITATSHRQACVAWRKHHGGKPYPPHLADAETYAAWRDGPGTVAGVGMSAGVSMNAAMSAGMAMAPGAGMGAGVGASMDAVAGAVPGRGAGRHPGAGAEANGGTCAEARATAAVAVAAEAGGIMACGPGGDREPGGDSAARVQSFAEARAGSADRRGHHARASELWPGEPAAWLQDASAAADELSCTGLPVEVFACAGSPAEAARATAPVSPTAGDVMTAGAAPESSECSGGVAQPVTNDSSKDPAALCPQTSGAGGRNPPVGAADLPGGDNVPPAEDKVPRVEDTASPVEGKLASQDVAAVALGALLPPSALGMPCSPSLAAPGSLSSHALCIGPQQVAGAGISCAEFGSTLVAPGLSGAAAVSGPGFSRELQGMPRAVSGDAPSCHAMACPPPTSHPSPYESTSQGLSGSREVSARWGQAEQARCREVNGPGVNGPGVNGQGVNGQGVNGQGTHGQLVNGQEVNGQGGCRQERAGRGAGGAWSKVHDGAGHGAGVVSTGAGAEAVRGPLRKRVRGREGEAARARNRELEAAVQVELEREAAALARAVALCGDAPLHGPEGVGSAAEMRAAQAGGGRGGVPPGGMMGAPWTHHEGHAGSVAAPTRPDLAQALAWAREAGAPEAVARLWWTSRDAVGWRKSDGGGGQVPVRPGGERSDLQAYLLRHHQQQPRRGGAVAGAVPAPAASSRRSDAVNRPGRYAL